MRLLLIRHGISTWNAERRWQGWADPPLSPEGAAQAEAVATALRGRDVRGVLSSDLARARSTAEIIAGALGLRLVTDPALRERNIGLWTGLTTEEIEARWPGHLAMYRANPEIQLPEGEGAEAVLRRAMPVLLAAARPDPDDAITLVVSHGGLIRCVRRALGAEDRPVPQVSGCWLEARDHGLRLVADTDGW